MKYFITILKHKWYVLKYGLKLKCPLYRLLKHDLSKLSPKEFSAYNNHFYGDKTKSLSKAYLHHQNHNDHHWEYWIDRTTNKPIPMEYEAILEMVSDWLSACKVYEGDYPKPGGWKWLQTTKVFNHLHKETSVLVVRKLIEKGFGKDLQLNKNIDLTGMWTENRFN